MLLKSPIRLLFALLVALYSLPSPAAGLYEGSAPVASQSDEDRAAALRAAFGQVIVKLTGNSAALTRPDVVRAMSRAERFMLSFGYVKDAAQPARLQLVVQFDRSGIDALLHDLNLDAAPADATGAAPAAAADGSTPAVAPTGGSYRLWITGLRSAEDYARLVGSLNGNDQVRALQVEQGHGNTVQVRVDARGSLAALLDALGAARIAHAGNTQPPVAGIDALLDYDP